MTLAELAFHPDYLALCRGVQADPTGIGRMAVTDWLIEHDFPDLAECWFDRTIRARPANELYRGGIPLSADADLGPPATSRIIYQSRSRDDVQAVVAAVWPHRSLSFQSSPGRTAKNSTGLLHACLIDAYRAGANLPPLVPSWLSEDHGPIVTVPVARPARAPCGVIEYKPAASSLPFAPKPARRPPPPNRFLGRTR